MSSDTVELYALHKAKLITNEDGYILSKDALKHVAVGDVVRLSMYLVNDLIELPCWSHDSPYLRVTFVGDELCGVVLDTNRVMKYLNMYPVLVTDKVWFTHDNIIELPTTFNGTKYLSFTTKDHVPITGPLYTIEHVYADEYDSSSGDELDD